MDDELSADLYEITQEMTERAGYPAYEISNHARGAGHESQHNRIYWASGDWAGIGPGAHGRLTADGARVATEAAERPGEYLKLVSEKGVGFAAQENLDGLAQARERIAMGLRAAEGLAAADIEALGFAFNAGRVEEFAELGLLANRGGRIALTVKGRLAADRIAAEIAP
jgi:oxygen-independent coproporphyrinogen-3 oxidase